MSFEYTHHGACVLRTPLLPFDVLRRGLTREHLRLLLADPIVREALFLASPSLDTAIEAWLADSTSPRARDAELIVARYVARMASRPTPFGLFSGCSVAAIGDSTFLTIGPARECRRSSRLDMQYLALLAEAVDRDPHARGALRFRPNSSIAIREDELRYIEARVEAASRARGFHLVTVEPSRDLLLAIERASSHATRDEIIGAMVRDDTSASREDAASFFDELVDAQILESEVQPIVTCEDPLAAFTSALATTDATRAAADRLTDVHGALRALDDFGTGASRDQYRAIMATLEPLPVPLDPARLFQVDLFKPSTGLQVGERVIDETRAAIALLHRMTPNHGTSTMRRFRERFSERYGDREVPLSEVLDEERGIGFDLDGTWTADPSPLLAGIALPAPLSRREPMTAYDQHKIERLLGLLEAGRREWVLDDRDLAALAVSNPAPLPDAFSAMVTVAASSSEAIDRGDFALHVHHISGPSGAPLLARFCHGDAEIRGLVERHIAAEEPYRPEAIFAEIVHLPEGRLGNVLCRPVLRSYEIPYLGVSGAPHAHQIPIDDLRVGVRGGAVYLRSARLDREVIPRLSSAHNHSAASLAVYRFLCALQYEGLAYALSWSWGALQEAPFLPRITRGRLVLSLATWTMPAKELESLAHDAGLRRARGLPQWVCVTEGDHVMPIDLHDDGAAAQLAALARGRQRVTLQELFPDPDHLCAAGADGRYTHEMVIPFVRARRARREPQPELPPESASSHPVRGSGSRSGTPLVRAFSPGSRWLYAKIYTGPATSDRVLRSVIAPLLRELRAENLIEGWFFIRYADPEPHLRVRFEGDPEHLTRHVLPRLHERTAPLLASGRIVRVQLDTYDREVERYGGPRAMPIAERIFAADSDAALAIVEATTGDAGLDTRWQLALYGVHAMLVDAATDDVSRRSLLTRARDGLATEHRIDTAARRSLGARYRTLRRSIEELVADTESPKLASAFDAAMSGVASGEPPRSVGPSEPPRSVGPSEPIRTRSAVLVPAFAELRDLRLAGQLETSWEDLLQSFLHMHVNRIIRAEPRTHEMVLYDFLLRAYESAAARVKK